MRDTIVVAFYIIGNLIGAGFFMMPATVAGIGVNMIWSWSIGATIALTFSLIFSRLYEFFPGASVLSDYFNDLPLKRTIAILYWIGAIVGNVLLLSMSVSFLKTSKISMLSSVGLLVILILTLVNHYFSEETVSFIEILLSLLKFSLLIFLPIMVFLSLDHSIALPEASGSFFEITKLGAMSFWAFLGIETAGVFGKGKAARNGLLLGIVACFVLYVLSCLLIVGLVPVSSLLAGKEKPLVLLINLSKFSYLSKYIDSLIAFTCLGTLYGWVAATSKMSLSYAESKVFPKMFANKTESGNSLIGLWLSSVVTFLLFVCVMSLNAKQQFEVIADFCVSITLFIFMLCGMVLFLKSSQIVDKVLGAFGVLLIAGLLLLDIQATAVSIILFIITLGVCEFIKE